MVVEKGERFYLRDIPLESLIACVSELTPREQEVFAWFATDSNIKGLAECLGISEGSVKVYESKLIKKVLKPLVPRVDAFYKRLALALLSQRYQEMRQPLVRELRNLCALRDERKAKLDEKEAALAEVNLWIKEKQDLLDKIPSLPLPRGVGMIGGWRF